MGRLEEKVAVITGAARGIGAATARIFAREGAKVAITDIDEEQGQATAAAIRDAGGEAVFIPVDVTDFTSVERMVQQVMDHFGRIDILVNNAGVLRDRTLLKMTLEDFNFVIDVNLRGVFHCTKAIAPIMVAQGKGVILNASSVVALYGNFGQTNYVASKAGVIGMTKVWARELGPKGIRVNAVAPGFIRTEMTAGLPAQVVQAVIQRTPLRMWGEPEDVAYAYLYLASDEARFVNGAVLSVDGGVVT
ncbi:MAG: 3-oxoacyl-ACP reductase FabG [Chloroflexi bacterium]|nr:3-oxoacyl-ACP reductase FabG [Chloroflexota bacterium]